MMRYRLAAYTITAILILQACGTPQSEELSPALWDGLDTSRAFAVSSETSKYMVRGTLHGELHLTSSLLVVVVTGGRVVSLTPQPRVGIRVIAARQSAGGWHAALQSDAVDIGELKAMQAQVIEESLTFSMDLPAGFDPQEHWLAFQFIARDPSGFGVSTTYACSERNILGPDSLSAARVASMRVSYEDAC